MTPAHVTAIDIRTAARLRQEGIPIADDVHFVVGVCDDEGDSHYLEFTSEAGMCVFLAELHPALFSDSLIACSVRRGRDEDSGAVLIQRWSALIAANGKAGSYTAH